MKDLILLELGHTKTLLNTTRQKVFRAHVVLGQTGPGRCLNQIPDTPCMAYMPTLTPSQPPQLMGSPIMAVPDGGRVELEPQGRMTHLGGSLLVDPRPLVDPGPVSSVRDQRTSIAAALLQTTPEDQFRPSGPGPAVWRTELVEEDHMKTT